MVEDGFRVSTNDPDGQTFEVAKGQWVKAKAVNATRENKPYAVASKVEAFNGKVTVDLPAEPGSYVLDVLIKDEHGQQDVLKVKFVVVRPLSAAPDIDLAKQAESLLMSERAIQADERY